MYYTINQQIIQARVADLHRQAQQDALARAARQSRRPPKRQSGLACSGSPSSPHAACSPPGPPTPDRHRRSRQRQHALCWSAPAGKLRCSRN